MDAHMRLAAVVRVYGWHIRGSRFQCFVFTLTCQMYERNARAIYLPHQLNSIVGRINIEHFQGTGSSSLILSSPVPGRTTHYYTRRFPIRCFTSYLQSTCQMHRCFTS